MRKDKICRRAITRLISSVLTFAIACMVVGTAVLPLSVAADELGEKPITVSTAMWWIKTIFFFMNMTEPSISP